jgi:hypothetical protein
MANELIRPIDPDSAHAIEETAKAAQKAMDLAAQAGNYVGGVLGDLPRDLAGIIGDWVKHVRARRWAELEAATEKILRERGVENRSDASPSVAIPLIAAAINEDRDGLKELWAKLLAAALDPGRAGFFRNAFIDAAKRMDPLDAPVLSKLATIQGGLVTDETRIQLSTALDVRRDEVDVSINNLVRLELLALTHPPNAWISPFGREFLRAIQ